MKRSAAAAAGENIMCIEASVGIGGANNAADVKIVQILLNMAARTPRSSPMVSMAGIPTPPSMRFSSPRARRNLPAASTPMGRTDQAARPGHQKRLDANSLQAVMTHASPARIALFLAPLVNGMAAGRHQPAAQQAHSWRYRSPMKAGSCATRRSWQAAMPMKGGRIWEIRSPETGRVQRTWPDPAHGPCELYESPRMPAGWML